MGRRSLKAPPLRARLIIVFTRQIMRVARLEIPRRQPPGDLSRLRSNVNGERVATCMYDSFDQRICIIF